MVRPVKMDAAEANDEAPSASVAPRRRELRQLSALRRSTGRTRTCPQIAFMKLGFCDSERGREPVHIISCGKDFTTLDAGHHRRTQTSARPELGLSKASQDAPVAGKAFSRRNEHKLTERHSENFGDARKGVDLRATLPRLPLLNRRYTYAGAPSQITAAVAPRFTQARKNPRVETAQNATTHPRFSFLIARHDASPPLQCELCMTLDDAFRDRLASDRSLRGEE